MLLGETLYRAINSDVSVVRVDLAYLERHLELSSEYPVKFDYTIHGRHFYTICVYDSKVEVDVPVGDCQIAYVGDYIVTNLHTGEKRVMTHEDLHAQYQAVRTRPPEEEGLYHAGLSRLVGGSKKKVSLRDARKHSNSLILNPEVAE